MKGHNVFKIQNCSSKSWLKLFTINKISRNELFGYRSLSYLKIAANRWTFSDLHY